MGLNLKETTIWVKKMVSESISGQINQNIEGFGTRIKFMAWVSTDGRTVECTKENGKIMKCQVQVSTDTRMGGDTEEIIQMMKKMDMEYTTGMTVVFMKAIGCKVNSMVLESIMMPIKLFEMGFGRMGNASSGLNRSRLIRLMKVCLTILSIL